jgi:hypothetical protein
MGAVWVFAGASEVFFVILAALFPQIKWLPLGGSHIAQLGVIFGFAFVVYEISKVV